MTDPRYRSLVRELLATERAYDCTVTRVIDGDTIDVEVDLGFNTFVVQRVRLFGVNCPELGTTEGRRVRSEVELWLGWNLIERPHLTLLSYGKLDKYGRRLADFLNPKQEIPRLSDFLLAHGYAVEYMP